MNNQKRFLVTGATGLTGGLIAERLRTSGLPVRAFARDTAKVSALARTGIEVVEGDLEDVDSIESSLAGVSDAYLVTWNGPTAELQRKNFVDAAKRVGNVRVVVGGAWGPPGRMVEQLDAANLYLRESGMSWTILQPTFFMQNLLMARQSMEQGALYWDMGAGKIPMIDARDVADVAVSVLTESGHDGKTYNLTGPEALSFYEAAAIVSRKIGRSVVYSPVSTDAAKRSLLEMGVSEWIADGYGELMSGYAEGWAADRRTNEVKALSGKSPRTFEEFVQDHFVDTVPG